MAKRNLPPAKRTSHNRYYGPAGRGEDTSSGGEKRSAKSGEFLPDSFQSDADVINSLISKTSPMSPLVFYDVQDAAQILEKAPVTVRKEAKEQQIGVLKGQGYLFNDQDILRLMAIFDERAERRRHPLDKGKPREEVGIARAVFEQLVYLKDVVLEFKKERDRFLMLFQDIWKNYQDFKEDTQERLKKLERGV